MADRALREDRDVGRARTDVDEHDAEFASHRRSAPRVLDAIAAGISSSTCRPQRLMHLVMFCARARPRTGDQMHVRFETHARHPDRMPDAFLRRR